MRGEHLSVPIAGFLRDLFETGDLALPRSGVAGCPEGPREFLVKYESVWRQSCPGAPPAFDCDLAVAASQVLLSMCQAVIFRDTEVSDSQRVIDAAGLPTGDVVVSDPSQHYSVDLLFQFLPQLIERAKRISRSDGLIPLLLSILQPWPLSAVGVTELHSDSSCPQRLQALMSHPSLWRMYTDRVLLRGDQSCLQHAETRMAVAAAIGPFDWLGDELSRHLQELGVVMNSEGVQSGE